jgi:choice-of-anchor A domain-containing protein/pilin isopeptide linkage protein
MTKAELISGLGIARNFGIVARNWTENSHLEAAVCVENATIKKPDAITNTIAVYRKDMNYYATVSKTGNVNSSDKFNIALFVTDENGTYTINSQKYSKVTDSERQISVDSPVTYNLNPDHTDAEIVKNYYIYETDNLGNPLVNGSSNEGYTVTYSNALKNNLIPNANIITALNNTSYIKSFSGDMTGNTPFNAGADGYFVFGPTVTFSKDSNSDWYANCGTSKMKFPKESNATNDGPKQATSMANYPIDFDDLFSNLKAYSTTLAGLTVTEKDASTDVRVINLKATTDSIDTKKGYVDDAAWGKATNLNTGETTSSIAMLKLEDDQYAVVNIVVPDSITDLSYTEQLGVNNENGNYSVYGSNVLQNFVRSDGTPYNGNLNISQSAVMGTFLAPASNMVLDGGSASAAYYAETFQNYQEVHYIPLGVNEYGSSKVTVNNGSAVAHLALNAAKTVDGNTPTDSETFDFNMKAITVPSGATAIAEQNKTNVGGSIDFDAVMLDKEGTYVFQVTETSDKAGYTKDSSVYTATVEVTKNTEKNILEHSAVTYKKDGTAVDGIVFENKKVTSTSAYGKVTIQKNGSDGPLLAKAHYKIYQQDSSPVQYYIAPTVSGTAATWTTDIDAATTLETDENGLVSAEGFTAGKYCVLEVAPAPEGYDVDSTPIPFEITAEMAETQASEAVLTHQVDQLTPIGPGDKKTTYEAPDTGDHTNHMVWFMVLGTSMMIAAGCLWMLKTKKYN